MEELQALIGDYYGLDWLTLVLGLTSGIFLTGGQLRKGFCFNIAACSFGLTVAIMSGQNGFVVYNALLIGLNIRGLLRGDRRASEMRTIELPVANDDAAEVMLQDAPVRAAAR